jgi:hypothetical protein
MAISPTPEYQIYQTVQAYAKYYPNKTLLIRYDIPRKVRVPGFEPQIQEFKPKLNSGLLWEESLRRTKTTIADLIICNEFDLFTTFTFDKKKVDRYSITECKKKMGKWLKNQREIHGKFKYIIVPEHHKDGAIHFHALFKNYRGKLIKGNTKTKTNRTIYNISSYQLGYSTAIPIDSNIEKVGNYVKKYITKDMPLFPGKKRYWSSQGLVRPLLVANPQIDPFTLLEFAQNYNKNGMEILSRSGTLQPQATNLKELQWHTQKSYLKPVALTTF